MAGQAYSELGIRFDTASCGKLHRRLFRRTYWNQPVYYFNQRYFGNTLGSIPARFTIPALIKNRKTGRAKPFRFYDIVPYLMITISFTSS